MKMKAIFAMLLLGAAGASVSCKVNAPLDPATMKPSCKCCPQNYYHGYASTCSRCGSEPIVSSK